MPIVGRMRSVASRATVVTDRRWIVRLVLIASLAIAGACTSSGSSNAPYQAADLNTGRSVSTAGLRGRPALLVSWATWCTQCRAELPGLEQYFEQHKADPLRIVLVNVNSSESRKEIHDVITRYGLSMIEWRDRDNEFGSRFRTVGVPTAVLLDASGKVVKIWPGAINPNGAELAAALRGMR